MKYMLRDDKAAHQIRIEGKGHEFFVSCTCRVIRGHYGYDPIIYFDNLQEAFAAYRDPKNHKPRHGKKFTGEEMYVP